MRHDFSAFPCRSFFLSCRHSTMISNQIAWPFVRSLPENFFVSKINRAIRELSAFARRLLLITKQTSLGCLAVLNLTMWRRLNYTTINEPFMTLISVFASFFQIGTIKTVFLIKKCTELARLESRLLALICFWFVLLIIKRWTFGKVALACCCFDKAKRGIEKNYSKADFYWLPDSHPGSGSTGPSASFPFFSDFLLIWFSLSRIENRLKGFLVIDQIELSRLTHSNFEGDLTKKRVVAFHKVKKKRARRKARFGSISWAARASSGGLSKKFRYIRLTHLPSKLRLESTTTGPKKKKKKKSNAVDQLRWWIFVRIFSINPKAIRTDGKKYERFVYTRELWPYIRPQPKKKAKKKMLRTSRS